MLTLKIKGRSLWLLFTQAVVVFAAAAFVFTIFRPINDRLPMSYSEAIALARLSIVSISGQDKNGSEGSIGSGVIISRDGYILTNYHLIASVDTVKISLQDGVSYAAEVIGIDPEIDIAVLRIKADHLPVLTFADDNQLAAGDIVFAIGNPFGLRQSASMGIVSAIGRNRLGLYDFEHFIQTDAAINPGSSGGALVNSHGHLVGINSALFYRQHGILPQGIGFAIPAGLAMSSAKRLISPVRDTDNVWGAHLRSLSPRLHDEVAGDHQGSSSVVVTHIRPKSPAARAGIRVGDIILEIDDNPPSTLTEAGQLPPVVGWLTILRSGDKLTLIPSEDRGLSGRISD